MAAATAAALAMGVGGAALGCGVSILNGVVLLELPFSMPVAIITGAVVLTLGVLVVAFVLHTRSHAKAAKAAAATGWCASLCACVSETFLLALFGAASIAGGMFAIWLHFSARTLPSVARTSM
jgi:hypothetical protein